MSELSDQDVQAIEDIHNRWISEELARNNARIVELCTNDIVWMPPDTLSLVGKEAIAEYLNENDTDLKDVEVTDVVIRGNDSIAYLTSRYHSRFVAVGASEVQRATGTHLWVLRKTDGRVWQVAVVAWNSSASETRPVR
jgi:ketosteroid isomerase-like protein